MESRIERCLRGRSGSGRGGGGRWRGGSVCVHAGLMLCLLTPLSPATADSASPTTASASTTAASASVGTATGDCLLW